MLPGTGVPAFDYCFPPPIMAGVVVQHLAECQAHEAIVVPDTRPYLYPRVQLASVKSLLVAHQVMDLVSPVAVFSQGFPGTGDTLVGA